MTRPDHDAQSFALGAVLGQILSSVQRMERKMDALHQQANTRPQVSRIERRIKDLAGIIIFLATLYSTGSLQQAVKLLASAAGP